jgi:hypothetical protein
LEKSVNSKLSLIDFFVPFVYRPKLSYIFQLQDEKLVAGRNDPGFLVISVTFVDDVITIVLGPENGGKEYPPPPPVLSIIMYEHFLWYGDAT